MDKDQIKSVIGEVKNKISKIFEDLEENPEQILVNIEGEEHE